MLKNIAILVVFSMFATAACMRTQVETNAANNSVSQANRTAESPKSESDGGKAYEKAVADNSNAKIFRGMINGTAFEMRLVRDENNLSGTYFYTKVRKDLKLSGTIEASGNFTLKETDQSGKATGEWSGIWKEEKNDNGTALEGTWNKPKESKDKGFSFYAVEQIIGFTGNVKFVDKTVKETNKAKRSDISSIYPELIGIEPATAAKFNARVKELVVAANNNFRQEVGEMTVEDVKSLPSGMGLSNEVDYNVALANNHFVSLILSNYTFMGGAHGSTSYTTVNYDLKNNRELKLEDIFEPTSNYLKTVSDICRADLKARLQKDEMFDEEMFNPGSEAEAENYQNWNLTKKGLMITFEAYQVAAYAAGPQTVIIPYDKLKSILRKDGVVASLVK